MIKTMDLTVCEIFYSIQGETTLAGFPSLFIRLGGCNLNCRWCDTPRARQPNTGTIMPLEAVLAEMKQYPRTHHVTVTGGEPLTQEGTPALLEKLFALRHTVQLETNGSLSLEAVSRGVRKIVDVKTPSSGEAGSFLASNLSHLTTTDELKFVVSNQKDFDFTREFMSENRDIPCVVNLTPGSGEMEPAELARLILGHGLLARLNLQLHRVIGLE